MAKNISASRTSGQLSQADIKLVKSLIRSVAADMRQGKQVSFDRAFDKWFEDSPHSLWVLFDSAVAASTAKRRDDPLIAACHRLIANQLELIRYQMERGHAWASEMIEAYQAKLVGIAADRTLPEDDFFAMVNLLKEAKIPLRPEMAEALLQAAADGLIGDPTLVNMPSSEEFGRQFRTTFDELGTSTDDPFEVVSVIADFTTLLPPELCAYMVHELGLSPHAVLREAVPLMLLDPVPTTRRAVAAVLEQIAAPAIFSPVMLRRTLLLRGWVPVQERDAIDRVVRKARLKGVECAQWAAGRADLAIQCSVIDGSGAQSMILTTSKGRTSLFAAVLLKQCFGVRDSWCEMSAPRSQVKAAVNGLKVQGNSFATERWHLDMVVRHHIARGVELGNLPQVGLVRIAEAIGASEWGHGQLIDVAAETERLFGSIDEKLRTSGRITASLKRSSLRLMMEPMLQSWFDDDAEIRALARGKSRAKREAAMHRMVDEVMPGRFAVWAERVLLLAVWLRAIAEPGLPDDAWHDAVILAHEILAGRKIADLPPMAVIAMRSLDMAGHR